MEWLQEKNKSDRLENGQIQFNVFAKGENLQLSLDNVNWFGPARKNGLEHEFEIKIDGSQEGQNFWVKEWGYLKCPPKNVTKSETVSYQAQAPNRVADNNIGLVGYKYGSSMISENAQISEGEFIFNFKGESGVNYPTPYKKEDNVIWGLDDLVAIHLPTHSVSTVWGDKTPSKVKLELSRNDSNIFELYDTKGGYHGNALAVGETPGQHLRGNNHPDDGNRWIKYGPAKIFIQNIGERHIVFEIACTSSGTKFKKTIEPGKSFVKEFDFVKLPTNTDSYKLNCNYMNDYNKYL
jgi:hypothetical protein